MIATAATDVPTGELDDLPAADPSTLGTIVVEPGGACGFAVTTRPLRFDLARHFPLAWQALEHAELLADEIGARVLDRTGVAA